MKRLSRSLALSIVLTTALALPAVAAPLAFPLRDQDGFPMDTRPPSVTAASWILYDESSDLVLAEWDADTRRPMASITKIMTVMLALENAELTDEVLISEEAAGQGGQEIDLVAGETVTLAALVKAAMIRSGNDAAAAIAEHVGGSIDGFVSMMNERAAELGMTNTHFVNPNGLDAGGHYSSARDMLVLSRQAMSIPEFEELSRSRAMVFPDSPNGTQRTATNTNRILNSYEGTIGVKTGETPNAGLTYVGAAERDGRRLIVVVLRSEGRRAHFADAIELYDWAFEDLSVQGMMTVGAPYVPLTARVAASPILAEASIGDDVQPSPEELTVSQPRSVASEDDDPPEPPQPIDVTRTPDPAPDSVLSTLTYWVGLMTGAFDD